MHVRARLGEHLSSPVPPVRRIENHLWALAPRGDPPRQLERVVVDANSGAQPLTLRRHPHDHTALDVVKPLTRERRLDPARFRPTAAAAITVTALGAPGRKCRSMSSFQHAKVRDHGRSG